MQALNTWSELNLSVVTFRLLFLLLEKDILSLTNGGPCSAVGHYGLLKKLIVIEMIIRLYKIIIYPQLNSYSHTQT